MSPTLAWVLVFATMAGLSAGQVLFKLGAASLERDGAPTPIPLLNAPILAALVIYAISTVFWISALRALPLRLAYPVSALAYVLVPVLGHFFLHEPLSLRTLAGAALIVGGVAIATSGE
jgi:drug/metabolite transporter (DMT)-like permease